MKKLFIQTYGCQMNLADSEEMAAHFLARGYALTDRLDQADVALVNTCTVRDHAEHRAVSFLGRLAKWKAAQAGRRIVFAGCAAQRLGEGLKKDFPFLDIVSGARNIDRFADMLEASGLFSAAASSNTAAAPALTGYITIMRGCDFACTYCIVPSVRGAVRCLPAHDVLARAAQKAREGCKEIMLLGQTVNAWREDHKTFADLLGEVSALSGVERVRFMSPHPAFVTPQFLEAVEHNPKIARHIHLPAQSGSTKVLREMKRGYSRETLLEKIDALQARGFAVSTDLIVGFPTETPQDFEDTLSLVERAGFSAAYCFKFSPRQGTPAALLKPLDQKTLELRLDILLNKVRSLADNAYAARVGAQAEILMETPRKGRTSDNFWVQTQNSHTPGSMVTSEIVSAEGTLLFTRD